MKTQGMFPKPWVRDISAWRSSSKPIRSCSRVAIHSSPRSCCPHILFIPTHLDSGWNVSEWFERAIQSKFLEFSEILETRVDKGKGPGKPSVYFSGSRATGRPLESDGDSAANRTAARADLCKHL